MRTAQYHLKKLNDNNQIFYNKLIGEIVDNLQNEFPDTLSLTEQGKFIIGYYQQEQDFYKKREEKEEEEFMINEFEDTNYISFNTIYNSF